jgi:ribosomal protein S27AE
MGGFFSVMNAKTLSKSLRICVGIMGLVFMDYVLGKGGNGRRKRHGKEARARNGERIGKELQISNSSPKPLKTNFPLADGMGRGPEKSMEEVEHEDLQRKCPECGSTDIETDKEEYYCKKCGMVLE